MVELEELPLNILILIAFHSGSDGSFGAFMRIQAARNHRVYIVCLMNERATKKIGSPVVAENWAP
jgi:hypothetical protein